MYIYNLISVYTRCPEDTRPTVNVLGTFSDFEDAKAAFLDEAEHCKRADCSRDYLGASDCHFTCGEESIHLSLTTSRISLSIS